MKTYLLPIVVVLLFFAACTPEQATPDVPGEGTPEDIPAQEAESEDGALDELMELFDAQENLEYQVAYDMTTTADGETMRTQMSQYLKGTERMRFDMEAEGMDVRTYMVDGTISSCMNQDGWTCFAMETAEDDGTAFDANEFREDFEEDPAEYEVNMLEPRTIAGASTSCFEIVSADSTVDYCMTRSGVPLYVHMTAEGMESTMLATSFSESVPDSAFDLPAEPTDMDAMMGFDPSMYDY